MEEQKILFNTAVLAKEKGFELDSLYFYVKLNSKMFGLDDRNRPYPIKNASKRLYKIGEHVTLNVENVIFAPTQSLLQKWLREIHNLHIYVDTTSSFDKMESHNSKYKATVKVPFQPFKWTTGKYYLGDTYELALEEGLVEGLKLIK